MEKNYQKPTATIVEMSFDEHIAASGSVCTYWTRNTTPCQEEEIPTHPEFGSDYIG